MLIGRSRSGSRRAEKKGYLRQVTLFFGPGGVIRTPDPYNPIVVRYQTALRPERAAILGS